MPAVVEWRKPTTLTITAAMVAPASGIRSRMPTMRPSATAYGTPSTEEHGRRDDAGDEADRQVAGYIAADRAVDVTADLPPARLSRLGDQAVDSLHPGGALQQHEERQERDRDDGDHRVEDALRHGESGARKAEHPSDAALLDRFSRPFDDLIVALEEAEPASTAREIVDVARHSIGEIVDLAHERRHERRGDPGDHEDRTDEDDPDGRTTAHAASHEELDRRIERHREEERNQDPDDHRARHPQNLENDRRGKEDADHGQDRTRPEANEALVEHAARA